MIRARRARIVATLGPASRSPEMVKALAEAGADVFRLNFSHGAPEDHRAALEAVRAAEDAIDRPLAVLADLQGPKLRLGQFEGGKAEIEAGQPFRLELNGATGTSRGAPMSHPEIFQALKPGVTILIDDGKLRLRVERCGPDFADTTVIQGGTVSDRKGVNLPGVILPLSALTDKDRADLAYALELGVDWVALSFVQKPEDMAELRMLVGGRAACLAKIEKPQALDRLDEILDLCDGVMVARGDLGVELPPEDVPVAQKQIIRQAKLRGAPVIVATQMLDSMVHSPTPTRAEASDVANTVYEGADAMMLSAESASGEFPVEAVAIMDRIISRVEQDPRWPQLMAAEHADTAGGDLNAIAAAATRAAAASDAACLVAFTAGGTTGRRLSRERPLQQILMLTPSIQTARKLALAWGVEPRVAADPANVEEMVDEAIDEIRKLGIAKAGEAIVIVAGVPFGKAGSTNMIRIAHV
ncbi:MAG: pyruvate kinase [Caulobacteraceae bacterium]|nr:pyruvate kinase [Caulobacteraceae bacterium]